MSTSRVAALAAGLLLLSMYAGAASHGRMQITVLDSVTRAVSSDDNGVPLNCEQLTFDAYCRSTSTVPLQSTLLVQEGDGPPFHITCTIESRYSRCTPLPKGATFATADLHIAFLEGVGQGTWLEAVPSIDRIGRGLIHGSCVLRAGDDPVARVLATFAVRLP